MAGKVPTFFTLLRGVNTWLQNLCRAHSNLSCAGLLNQCRHFYSLDSEVRVSPITGSKFRKLAAQLRFFDNLNPHFLWNQNTLKRLIIITNFFLTMNSDFSVGFLQNIRERGKNMRKHIASQKGHILCQSMMKLINHILSERKSKLDIISG